MCVVSAAIGAVSSVVGYIGQSQQAAQQAAYQNQVYAQQQQQALDQANYQNRLVERQNQYITDNAVNTLAALRADRAALVSQERQETIAVALEAEAQRIEKLRAQGAIRATGKTGANIETLLADFDRQEAVNRGTIQRNLAFASAQRVRQGESLTATAQSRINQARPYEAAPFQSPTAPAPVQGPSLLGLGVNLAGQVYGAYSSRQVYDSTKNRYVLDRGNKTAPTALPQADRWTRARSILQPQY